jgi:acetate kinase
MITGGCNQVPRSQSHAAESNACLLTLNAGSSSIRFAVFRRDLARALSGKIDRIGLPASTLEFRDTEDVNQELEKISAPDHAAAASYLVGWLEERVGFQLIGAVGHRVVHGGPNHLEPRQVTQELLEELKRISPFDPEHLPAEIGLIETLQKRFPDLPQVACFDTGFHRDLPRVASLLPIPRWISEKGVRRYGFHGLSYAFLMEEVRRLCGEQAAAGRIVLAHLGNGASMAAVRNGHCIDTSMAFTPTAGLPMSTRSGDLDPGLVWFLAQTEQMGAERFNQMVNRESGLLGISETSSDMRDLMARRGTDVRAAEAVALFCYQARKWLGGFAAALGGLDLVVFSGGIGENVPEVRAGICEGLEFLGIEMNAARNRENAHIISKDESSVAVRVIKTDEEQMIAKAVAQFLQNRKG